MAIPSPDDRSSLQRARERLYAPGALPNSRQAFRSPQDHSLPHRFENDSQEGPLLRVGERRVRLAGIFFIGAFLFFMLAVAVAGYFLFIGGNTVSVDKISIDIQGPTTIAGGDTVPLSLTITNKNPVALNNATIEIDFPEGTRNADNVLEAYPRFVENLGQLESGATITRSVKAVLFAGSGATVTLLISLSYGASGSNAVFVKKLTYPITISSTPLSVSVETLTETVSGKQFPFTLTVRSNATVPLNNVVLVGAFPFGFTVASSSLPMNNSSFFLGTLAPGATRTITLTGSLTGQDKEQRVFHFTVGTAPAPGDTSLAVSYMTQDATLAITAPFIHTALTVNGNPLNNAVLAPGALQAIILSYGNTLSTNVTNAEVRVALSGAAIDYGSVRADRGFYDSGTRTIVFSADADPAFASLSPGASGVSSFTFTTLPTNSITASPLITFSVSVSGTRVGQTNVLESVANSSTYTARVATVVGLTASSLYSSGPIKNIGPIPPQTGQTTTYTVLWNVQNSSSAVAGGVVTATIPSYVTYTGSTAGTGSIRYDSTTRMVTWNVGDLAQRASAQGFFQVSLTPSTTQRGSTPSITGPASFSGHDRFAGVQVTASADPATTETKGDTGYVPANASVQ